MKISDPGLGYALAAWLTAVTAAYLWQFRPLFAPILDALGLS